MSDPKPKAQGPNWSVPPELYRQAHETRRKWEGYIWQWGILLTVLAAVFVKWAEPQAVADPAEGGVQIMLVPCNFSFVQKMILSLIAGFVMTIFVNVLRARVLMKELEKTIQEYHKIMGNVHPVVPAELNQGLKGINRIGSTKLAVWCHFLAALVFLTISIYAWVR